MKRIIVMTAGLVAVATGVVGCLSAQLRSEDPQTRLAAVGEVKEESVLQEIAQGAEYRADVRVAAMKRLSDPQDLWRIWSENEDNPEIARGALDALKDDDYLVQVSLSPRTNEALVAVGRLSSLSACSNVAVRSTVVPVQLAAFRKFLEQTQDEDSLRYALEHGKMHGLCSQQTIPVPTRKPHQTPSTMGIVTHYPSLMRYVLSVTSTRNESQVAKKNV